MKTPAKIELTTTQNGESISILSDGEVYFQNDAAYVEYDGADNTRTCIGISPDLVTLSRIGEGNYTMILEEGKTGEFDMVTPEGTLRFSTKAKKVQSEINSDSIRLMLVYDLSAALSETETTVTMKCEFQR